MKKQLERMHKQFGRAHAYKCGTCCNYFQGRYHDRVLRKCARYGASHSEASDWAQSWPACGKHNQPLANGERPLMEHADRRREPEGEVPGQVGMLGPGGSPLAGIPDHGAD